MCYWKGWGCISKQPRAINNSRRPSTENMCVSHTWICNLKSLRCNRLTRRLQVISIFKLASKSEHQVFLANYKKKEEKIELKTTCWCLSLAPAFRAALCVWLQKDSTGCCRARTADVAERSLGWRRVTTTASETPTRAAGLFDNSANDSLRSCDLLNMPNRWCICNIMCAWAGVHRSWKWVTCVGFSSRAEGSSGPKRCSRCGWGTSRLNSAGRITLKM